MAVQKVLVPTLDTSAYADGDLLFEATEVSECFPGKRGGALLESVFVIDKADQGAAFDLLFFDALVDVGTLNAAPTISDADALLFQGRLQITADDYYDLGGARVASKASCGIVMSASSASRSLWVAGISRGSATFAADSLKIRLGLVW